MHIAILGSTSHIAKNLIYYFEKKIDMHLSLFSRQAVPPSLPFNSFLKGHYDVIINLIGLTNIAKLDSGDSIITVNERYDNLALSYLKNKPKTKYIYTSSGIVHSTLPPISLITEKNYYYISKISSEIKHRSLPQYAIVDLRIFSFFSRFINLEDSFFINDIIKAIQNKKPLHTSALDFSRDYCDPEDFFRLILTIIKAPAINTALDVKSQSPISKLALLETFKNSHNLVVKINDTLPESSTGFKKCYYSTMPSEKTPFTFEAKYSSLDTIIRETTALLGVPHE